VDGVPLCIGANNYNSQLGLSDTDPVKSWMAWAASTDDECTVRPVGLDCSSHDSLGSSGRVVDEGYIDPGEFAVHIVSLEDDGGV
jgi:hypothetical protein